MRAIAISLAVAAGLSACSKGDEAREAARKEAEAEDRAKAKASGGAAEVIRPPVPGQTKLKCSQVINLDAFQQELGEKEPLTIKEKGDPDATSSCGLHRGGKRPGEAAQKEILKKEGRLGVLPGDELCHVSLYCSTIETLEKFKKRCTDRNDESMGSYACVQVVAQGADDVPVFKFFDEDTKCIIRVGGGPSNVNGDSIRSCAKAARSTIGPDQIAVGAGGDAAPAPAGSGS
ncbi:MAG TPA: hypothetical protein VNO30_17790 [Kofleriaceae bacterium]|nr:hypothetical protein [Kofleriaceae bacterium]